MLRRTNEDKTGVLRIGMISDVHCGPSRNTHVGAKAIELLDRFVAEMNVHFKPDLVVDLGDRVLDVDRSQDTLNQKKVRSAFERLSCPVVHILGNHDSINLSREENEDIFQQSMEFRSFDLKGVHFVVLNTSDPPIEGVGGKVSRLQLEWFTSDLKANPGKSVILCHHALGYQDISSNVLFESIEPLAYVENRDEIWNVLKNRSGIAAVLHGHLHWNSREVVHGVPCFCVNSPVETWNTGGRVSGSYAEVVVSAGSGSVAFTAKSLFQGLIDC